MGTDTQLGQKAVRYRRATRALDIGLRWPLIVGSWAYIGWMLLGIAWYWAALWIVPGFFVTMNVIGLATLPVYAIPAWIWGPRIVDRKAR